MPAAIGPKGHLEIVATGAGPQRAIRVLEFLGRVDTGFCDQPFMRSGENPLAIFDVTKGRLVTSSFGGVVNGGLSQTDTGGLGDDGTFEDHVMLAFVTDTGTVGL